MKVALNPTQITSWIASIGVASHYTVKDISLSESKEWMYLDGQVKHKTGGFFQVINIVSEKDGHISTGPLIDQQEIGTLGALISDKDAQRHIMIYGKVEPGNVSGAQIAPSCQATRSNLLRVHGGDLPPCSIYFSRPDKNQLYASLQSEQGSRFYKKRNNNTIVSLPVLKTPPDTHTWVLLSSLFDLMHVDFLINTDLRSVLVSAPWKDLIPWKPFKRIEDDFSSMLARSYESVSPDMFSKVKNTLDAMRQSMGGQTQTTPLNLTATNLEGPQIVENEQFVVRQVQVHVEGREKSNWDQPIIQSKGSGQVQLVCAMQGEILRFLFTYVHEPGLYNGVELGPTLVSHPGEKNKLHDRFFMRARVKQSDEGGRFFQDVSEYALLEDQECSLAPADDQIWLSLGEVQELIQQDGIFTNEARSALSLVLKWI